MRAIYLDCFSGLSGNMLLGAFLAAGVPLETLEAELRTLPITEEFRLKVSPVKKNGIAATYVDVELLGEKHAHAYEHAHEHPHRTMRDVRDILERASLSVEIKETSLKIFSALAQAEGKVHGVRPEDVYFHEVGAVDSIVDIVGVAICLDYLEIE